MTNTEEWKKIIASHIAHDRDAIKQLDKEMLLIQEYLDGLPDDMTTAEMTTAALRIHERRITLLTARMSELKDEIQSVIV